VGQVALVAGVVLVVALVLWFGGNVGSVGAWLGGN
jgi:hypothetical protein